MNHREKRACLNCGTELRGAFCDQCGQRELDLNESLGLLLKTAAGDLFSFDSRLLRTLRPLLTRPGLLTQTYLAGKRARFVPPFRLYIFISFAFFLSLTFSDYSVIKQEKEGDINFILSPGDGASDPTDAGPDDPQSGLGGATRNQQLVGFFDRFEQLVTRDTARFNSTLIERMGQLLILLVPAFALFLKAVYRNRQRSFVYHLVHSLHIHSFAFLLFLVGLGLALTIPMVRPFVTDIAFLIVAVYLLISLRRVYGGRRWVTVLRLALLVFVHLVTLLAIMIAILIVSIYFTD